MTEMNCQGPDVEDGDDPNDYEYTKFSCGTNTMSISDYNTEADCNNGVNFNQRMNLKSPIPLSDGCGFTCDATNIIYDGAGCVDMFSGGMDMDESVMLDAMLSMDLPHDSCEYNDEAYYQKTSCVDG